MFTAALFQISKTGNNPNTCPSTEEEINKLHIHSVERHSAIKGGGILICTTVWVNLKYIILNATSQKNTDSENCATPFTQSFGTGKINLRWKKSEPSLYLDRWVESSGRQGTEESGRWRCSILWKGFVLHSCTHLLKLCSLRFACF